MKILADENIPILTIETLRASGHDVLSLHDSSRKGVKDLSVWHVAQDDQRMIVTTDKGFSRYREESRYGILIIRLFASKSQISKELMIWSLKRYPTPKNRSGRTY